VTAWRWRNFAAGVALAALILATVLAALWLYYLTVPDCWFNCPPASGSVSNAPG
jgi:hypothetical protein